MAEETFTSSEIPVAKLAEEVESNGVPIKIIEEDTASKTEETKKEEAIMDGEFIKVDKESFDVKDGSNLEEKSPVVEHTALASEPTRDLLESQEKIKDLENELHGISCAAKEAESENRLLKEELMQTKEKLLETTKKHEDLELSHKKLLEKFSEAEDMYNEQLKTLQETLQAQEEKHKELTNVKEAFDRLSLELEISSKKMQELEIELKNSSEEARKYEELHKQSGLHVESETRKALEFEKLLEVAKSSAKDREDQMDSLKDELKSLYEKISENHKVEEALRSATTELANVRGELESSKSEVLEVEQRLASKEILISELNEELEITKAAQSNSKADITSLEGLLDDFKAKLKEEVDAKEGLGELLKSEEIKIKIVQEDLERVIKEKQELENAVSDLTNRTVEMKELSEKISADLNKEVEEKQKLDIKLQEFQAKVAEIESELAKSTSHNSELEVEIKHVTEKCAEHEGRANTIHERSLELESLIQKSDSKAVDAEKKVSELEILLETEKYRIKELEEQVILLEKNRENVEVEFLKSSQKASELEAELEVVRLKTSSLEAALQASTEREKELNEYLNLVTEENRNLKELSKTSNEKLSETENLLSVLRNEVSITQERLQSVENDLKASGTREIEVTDKLKLTEEKLEQQREVLEEVTAKSAELESYRDKVQSLEILVKSYEAELAEANERHETAIKELNQILEKLASSEGVNEELRRELLEAEGKADSYFSENVSLSENNARLSEKVKDLEEKLIVTASEMEISAQQLASHMNTITELTEKHSKVSELHLAAEDRILEAEAELEEAIQKSSLRDLEAKDLYEKLKAFEAQVSTYEGQAREASELVKSRELETEQVLLKSRDLENELEIKSSQFKKETEALIEANSKLTEELGSFKSEVSDLQTKLSVVSSEKDHTVEELNTARKEIEELTHKLASEGQKLQSQISSVMEENSLLNEKFQSSKNDLQTTIINLEEQLREQKSNESVLNAKLEILNADVGQKAELENHLKELEEQLATAEARYKEEKELSSQKVLENESALKHSCEELETKKKEALLLEKQVKDLEQRLQLADAKSKEKDIGGATSKQKDDTIKSRGIDISTPSKRKGKNKSDATAAQAPSSENLRLVEPDRVFIERLQFLNSLDPSERRGTSLVTEGNLFGAGLRLTDPSTEVAHFLPVFYPLDPRPDQMSSVRAQAEARMAKLAGKKGTMASSSGSASKRKAPIVDEPSSKKALVNQTPAEVLMVDSSPTQTSQTPIETDRPPVSSPQHPLGINQSREEACVRYGDGRPPLWLDFVKAATPTVDKVATFPESVRDTSEVPFRAFTPELARSFDCMGVDEQIQFSSVLIGQALNVVVHSAGGVLQLKREHADLERVYADLQKTHADLLGRHESLREAHLGCSAVQESLQIEVDRAKKALAKAEQEGKKMADQLVSAFRDNFEQRARLEEEKKATLEQVAKAREEGLEAGRSEGQEVFRRSTECDTLFNLTYVGCFEDLISKVEAGATAEDLKAALKTFKKENDLEEDEDVPEVASG